MINPPSNPARNIRVLTRIPGPGGDHLALSIGPAGGDGNDSHIIHVPANDPGESSACPPGLRNEVNEAACRYLTEPPLPFLPEGQDPMIMGVLNLTPDSFSDGGLWTQPEKAIARTEVMLQEGADIIDIGGESTRPGAQLIPPAEEIERVVPVIRKLRELGSFTISIDTRKAEVADAALDAGADLVNDISALADPEMASLCAKRDCPVVLMHMLGTPETMQHDVHYTDPVAQIYAYLYDRVQFALAAGIKKSNLLIDPGIGFGKRVEDNLAILRRIGEFRTLGLPILVGTSRKSFIGACLDRSVPHRLYGTAATVTAAVLGGAQVLRVHDVKAMRDTILMAAAMRRGQPAEGRVG